MKKSFTRIRSVWARCRGLTADDLKDIVVSAVGHQPGYSTQSPHWAAQVPRKRPRWQSTQAYSSRFGQTAIAF